MVDHEWWRSLHGRRLTNGQIQLPRTTREEGPTADGKDYRTVPPVANAGGERKVRLPNWSNKLD